MKAWTRDNNRPLESQLRGLRLCPEDLAITNDADYTKQTPSSPPSSYGSTKTEEPCWIPNMNRNQKPRKRPMSSRPGHSGHTMARLQHKRLPSCESLSSASEVTATVTDKQNRATIAWAGSRDELVTTEMPKKTGTEERLLVHGETLAKHLFHPENSHATLKMCQSELRLSETAEGGEGGGGGYSNGAVPSCVSRAPAFPLRRNNTLSVPQQTGSKNRRQSPRSAPSKVLIAQQGDMNGGGTNGNNGVTVQFHIPLMSASQKEVQYDIIDTERLLRLNLSDPSVVSHLQEELISRHTTGRQFISTAAPPSSPRFGSPTVAAETSMVSVQASNMADMLDNNMEGEEEQQTEFLNSPSKNGSIINLCEAYSHSPSSSSSTSSSHISSGLPDVKAKIYSLEKEIETEQFDNKAQSEDSISTLDGETVEKEIVPDVRVRSVQLLCTHSGRLRHTATLIETNPSNSSRRSLDREVVNSGAANSNVTKSNKVFVAKNTYTPIKMVYENSCKPVENIIPPMVPHLQRYFTNLQKKQDKLREERGNPPQGCQSLLKPSLTGIYKTVKTLEFGLMGPQEIVEKTLIGESMSSDRRPKTSYLKSDSINIKNKMRPQSGPSRFMSRHKYFKDRATARFQESEKDKEDEKEKGTVDLGSQLSPNRNNQQIHENYSQSGSGKSNMQMMVKNQQLARVHFRTNIQQINGRPPSASFMQKRESAKDTNNVTEKPTSILGTKKDSQNLNEKIPNTKTCDKKVISNTLKNSVKMHNDHKKGVLKSSDKNSSLTSENKSDPSIQAKLSGVMTDKINIENWSQNNIYNGIYEKNLNERTAVQDFEPSNNTTEQKEDIEEYLTTVPFMTKQDLFESENNKHTLSTIKEDLVADTPSSNSPSKNSVKFEEDFILMKKSDLKSPSVQLQASVLSIDSEVNGQTGTTDSKKSPELCMTTVPDERNGIPDYYLTTAKYLQPEKESNYQPKPKLFKDINVFSNFQSEISSKPLPGTSISSSFMKPPLKKEPTAASLVPPPSMKSERRYTSSKKTKSGKTRKGKTKSQKTARPLYLTSVQGEIPKDAKDIECEKISDELLDNGVLVSWKTLRRGLYPPTGRALHYDIEDTGLLESSDLLSHPKNWFPKEFKALQQATKKLERAELSLWRQRKAEEKKTDRPGSRRKKKLTKKKKK